MLGGGSAMVIEGDQGQWLLAKAQQLKGRALGTADRARRKQFLLIATEYQKLAQQENGGIALDVERVVPTNTRTPQVGVVIPLRLTPQRKPAVSSNVVARSRFLRAFRRPEIVNLTIWAIFALISFILLLAPGDQTAQGLRDLLDIFTQ
jgi:hypothetical protein